MIFFWVVEALAGLIENLTGFLFVSDVIGAEKKRYRQICLCSVILTMGLLCFNSIQLFMVLATFYGLIGMTVCIWMIYRKNLKDIIISVCSFFLVLYSEDFLLISLIGSITGNRDYGTEIIAQQSWLRMKYILAAKAVLIISYALFHRYAKKITVFSRKILIGSFLALGLVFILIKKLCAQIDGDVVGTGILFFLIVVMGIYLMMQYSEMKEQRIQMALMEERSHIMMSGYQDMLKNYSASLAYHHDLKNHMITLERYLLDQNYEKAAEYVRTLTNDSGQISMHAWTGIEIIDFILNTKNVAADEAGIEFSVDADSFYMEEIMETDLCALLGNALDNAIEGCETAEGRKEIHVSIRRVQEMFLIKVSNTCKAMPEQNGGLPATSKKEKELHGWGMRSMEMVMKKYNGTMQYGSRDGTFSVIFTFFF